MTELARRLGRDGLAGPLGALIIRRPGAALACELLAASFQGLLGTTFGATVVISGLIQGAAAEVVFLSSGYRRFGPAVAIASGALAGALGTLSECLIYYYEWPMAHQAVYVVLGTVSGAVIAPPRQDGVSTREAALPRVRTLRLGG